MINPGWFGKLDGGKRIDNWKDESIDKLERLF